jgi:hypothetical protein
MSIPTAVDGVTPIDAALLNAYKSGIEACEPALPLTTEGDLLMRGAAANEALPVGNEGDVLTVASGVPSWRPNNAVVCPGTCDARLTLTTGVPVTSTDVTGASTIYLTPYQGNMIALYDGSAWVYHTLAEISLALADLTSGKNYDVFCHDNSGTLVLTLSSAWSTDTARNEALAYQDGVRVLASDHTKRLVGTIRATGATTTEDSLLQGYVCNEAHPVLRKLRVTEATGDWTYATQAWRPWKNNTNCKVQALFLPGYMVEVVAGIPTKGDSSNNGRYCGIAIDSDTDLVAEICNSYITGTVVTSTPASWRGNLSEGYHYIRPMEWSLASGTATYLGGTIGGNNHLEVLAWR